MHLNHNRRAVGMRNRRRTCILLVLTVLFVGAALGGARVRISGTVRDSSGRSLAHAYVKAVPVVQESGAGRVGSSGNPWVAADSSGAFTLSLPPGQFRIKGKDEMDGYPDPSFWLGLDPEARFPEIMVGNEDIDSVEVVVGIQGGILSGHIVDARTNSPIANAKIRIQDAQNSYAFVEVFTNSEGHFRYTVPNKPILIFVTAAGYKEFQGDAEQTLSHGEQRNMEVELEYN